jgi:hypothetical protein
VADTPIRAPNIDKNQILFDKIISTSLKHETQYQETPGYEHNPVSM